MKRSSSLNVAETLAACGVMLLISASMLTPWILGGSVLAPLDIVGEMYLPWRGGDKHCEVHNHFVTDAATQYLPYRIIAARAFEKEGYLGWNPLMFGGTAQAANTMALSSDWGMQLHRFLSFWTAWHVSVLGRFLIAGLGMLVFLRSRGCQLGAATALGSAYMLNTEFVSWIYHQWAVASFCWMPWVLWALYGTREKSPRFLAPAAVFLGLALMGSTLQHAAFIVIALGCLWVGWLVEGKEGAFPLARSGLPSRWRDTATIATAGLLGAGLVAFVLEPAISGYLENLRSGHTREGIGYAFGLSQPLRTLIAWPLTFYPFVLGSVQTLDLTKAFVPSGLAFAFFGTVPMLLAVVGLFSERVPAAAKLLIGAGLIIPLTPLVGVLYQRVSLLWILGGCWAAGVWISTAKEAELRTFGLWLQRLLFVVIPLWLAASVAMIAFRGPLDDLLASRVAEVGSRSQFGIFSEWLQTRASNLLDYLCIWNPWQLLGLAGLLVSFWGVMRLRSASTLPGMALAAGVTMQLSVFWWQWTTWSSPENVYAGSEIAQLVQREVGETGRLAQAPGTPAEMFFPPNTLMPLGVAITGGYDSIHPDGMRSPTGEAWEFPGTTHFIGPTDTEYPRNWQQVWSDGRWTLLRNPSPSLGIVTLTSGLPIPLRPADFKRGSMNTMEAVVPPGSVKLELFSNWHRGWKWRDDLQERWSDTSAGPTKGVEVEFDQPTAENRTVYLQFDPSPPNWVLVITGLSGMVVLALSLSGGKDTEAGE